MTNNNFNNKNNAVSNSARTKNRISLSMQGGTLSGNLISLPPIEIQTIEADVCGEASLDLSCAENSQYVAAL